MNIELNKEYITRQGDRITVTSIEPDHHLPLKGSDGERRNELGFYCSSAIPHPLDLVLAAKQRPRLYAVTLSDGKTFRRAALSEKGAEASLKSIIDRDGLTVTAVELVI